MYDLFVTVVLGGITAFGFFNPSFQLLIPLCLIALVVKQSELKTINITSYFISLHTFGSLWLMVPIHVIGGVNFILASFLICVLGLFFGAIYGIVYQGLQYLNQKKFYLSTFLLLPITVVIAEFFKLKLIGGFPFLLFTNFYVGSHYQFLIPYLGIYGCCWLLILVCNILGSLLKNKQYKPFISILLVLFCIYCMNIETPKYYTPKKPIDVYLIHTNKHYISNNNVKTKNIETTLYNQQVDLILYPEAMYKSLETIKPNHKNQYTLTGFINYNEQRQGFENIMIGINDANQIDFIHKKYHLAQFNEWIPNSIQYLLKAMHLPYNGFSWRW